MAADDASSEVSLLSEVGKSDSKVGRDRPKEACSRPTCDMAQAAVSVDDGRAMSHGLESRAVAAVISDITTPAIAAARHNTQQLLQSAENKENREAARDGPTILPSHKVSQTEEKELSTLSTSVELNVEEVQKITSSTQKIFITLIAGAMAGALAKSTIAPLDRTKINFQATQQKFSAHHAIRFLVACYQKEGLFSFWRGNSATMARIIPYAAIQFTSHEQFKIFLRIDDPNKATPHYYRFLAGSLAGVTSQFLTYPLDMARARMAITHKDTYSSLIQVFAKIWKHEGPLTLYRGLTPTLLGVIPYAGTSFGIYETLKNYHSRLSDKNKPNPLERMMFGAIAGLVGQSSSYPLDIVRRRMQTANITGNGNSYKTILGTLSKVYREEGLRHGLYKGLSMNWIKGPIAVGISFSTFDTLKINLEYFLTKR